jgi:tungstate transport system ATP-binding protein
MVSSYSIRDLVFSYSDKPALTIESLDIPASEIVALVGPNGSGKTTLLHLLAFILTPQHGTICFFEEPVRNENLIDFRRKVGLLPQNPYLFRSSVLDNVTVGLKLRGTRRHVARKIARESLVNVGMEGFESRQAACLSGGEAQRVALARTLALNPDVLLFDEPGNHLDLESVKRTEQAIMNLSREKKKTVIFTTHNRAFAHNLTNSVIQLFHGRVFQGTSSIRP